MPRELFLVPMEGQGTRTNPYRGKYTRDPVVTLSGALRAGRQDMAIALIEAPQSYLNGVAGQADALRLATEANLDGTLTTNQANAAKARFEEVGIPGQFINAGDTRRQAIRGVVGMFLFSQRMEGRFGEGFWQRAKARGITLDSQWSDFPQALKDEFLAIRDEHGWDNLGLTNQSTLRQIMQAVSQQFEATPIEIAGVAI